MAIQLKRSLETDVDPNYILQQGQIGIEMPTAQNLFGTAFRFKIGDGSTTFANLPYAGVSDKITIGNRLLTYDATTDLLTIT